ncbi:DUF421 domain-containing protein [Wenzhouxiangella sp. XN79A]|uniref:DUF421 domain-containing protein n=1 Tax=Wenzhouxiangella sp. XN79A TaxID=2724193 RepID=UPI00144A93F7|nr:YetF domain-containing protein [Wenzhouxiangella sp. XN79A]NKI34741.1 DUF421 domain-containing protein [Wenzhouxiangella sp. XN79A]
MFEFDLPLIVDLILRAFLVMITIVLASRIFGLRSFSKMSSFDFSVTVAIGSVLATAVTMRDQSVWVPITAVLALFVWQMTISPLRRRIGMIQRAIDNRPLLVVEDGKVLNDNLARGGMTRADLWSRLRAANVAQLEEVKIAVLETTGDVTVIHGSHAVSPELLEGVQR